MSKFITLTNKYYEILMPEYLEEFGHEVSEYSTKKIKEYQAFFNNREDFIARIKRLDKKANPPSWAQGCFYSGEILINNMKIDYERKIEQDGYTILDESLKYFKEKYGIINIGGYNEKNKNNRKR